MAIIAQPVWTGPTGTHTIITPAGRPPPSAPNRPTRNLVYSAITLGGLSAASWFAYSHVGWERLVTLGQMCALLAGVCIIAVCHLRATREQNRADLASVHLHIRDALAEGVGAINGLGTVRDELHDLAQAVTSYRGALVDLPEQLRDRMDRQAVGYQALVMEAGGRIDSRLDALERDRAEVEKLAKEHTGLTRLVLEELRGLGTGVGQMAGHLSELRQRVEAVEKSARAQDLEERLATIQVAVMELLAAKVTVPAEPAVDEPPEGDDRYLAGYADGLAGRALGEGNVVPFNANGHGRGRSAT